MMQDETGFQTLLTDFLIYLSAIASHLQVHHSSNPRIFPLSGVYQGSHSIDTLGNLILIKKSSGIHSNTLKSSWINDQGKFEQVLKYPKDICLCTLENILWNNLNKLHHNDLFLCVCVAGRSLSNVIVLCLTERSSIYLHNKAKSEFVLPSMLMYVLTVLLSEWPIHNWVLTIMSATGLM